jgi:hypothetical protein
MLVIMETLLWQKRQTKDLEVDCTALCHQVSSLTKESQSTTCIYRVSIGSNVKETTNEETIYQMPREEDIDGEEQDPQPSSME